jgi:hypothetical protein
VVLAVCGYSSRAPVRFARWLRARGSRTDKQCRRRFVLPARCRSAGAAWMDCCTRSPEHRSAGRNPTLAASRCSAARSTGGYCRRRCTRDRQRIPAVGLSRIQRRRLTADQEGLRPCRRVLRHFVSGGGTSPATPARRARPVLPPMRSASSPAGPQYGSYMFGIGPIAPTSTYLYTPTAAVPAAATRNANAAVYRRGRTSRATAAITAAMASTWNRSAPLSARSSWCARMRTPRGNGRTRPQPGPSPRWPSTPPGSPIGLEHSSQPPFLFGTARHYLLALQTSRDPLSFTSTRTTPRSVHFDGCTRERHEPGVVN